MVKNNEKTYGQLMVEAREKQDRQEIGETTECVMNKFRELIDQCVNDNYEKGIRGKYYVHIWAQKEPYANNALHLYTQCRRTRPSPYQSFDHFLWSVQDGGIVTFEWCIPKKEVTKYILHNPNKFDERYVAMLRKYAQDKLEHISDYAVNGKIA